MMVYEVNLKLRFLSSDREVAYPAPMCKRQHWNRRSKGNKRSQASDATTKKTFKTTTIKQKTK
jgi:hypothetical protein